MSADRPWTFLTNHAHVLLAVAGAPDARVVEIAEVVGVSTRSALSILGDLEEAGYVTRVKVGRRTHYAVRPHQPFRHPADAAHEVDELLAVFRQPPGSG
ncbi:helix-turn-helix domain-containing protein [Modestobacter sp. VKM Ac-2986]|uniref:helix-turn-helix transcriptional regulator n=1 Tax=Modestobacter sp. VKM Ac-2986 TaxID=3004140 RepID=UPI0022AB17C5|nr:helix-turn-helix domain-containing protein [Modestobacter sp. VKM Ac-2986]MCZ2828808.1 helix-turn-helix domain-containing protein [Modestobacter sp. VKM Ac-2986]